MESVIRSVITATSSTIANCSGVRLYGVDILLLIRIVSI